MPVPGERLPARSRPWRKAAVLAAVALLPSVSSALGPHEVALVVNDASMDSILLARSYARLRAVPACNVVRVSVPAAEDGSTPAAMTREAFERLVFQPASRELEERGLAPQILAWVYSCGFPARVAASEETLGSPGPADLSITGATFVRCQWPADADVEHGAWTSSLYAGPDGPGEDPAQALSFDQLRNDRLADMPLPAAMLAWTGRRGISLDQAVESIARSAENDGSAPEGAVWFARSDDIRSTCRDWQFEAAAAAAEEHPGVRAVVATNLPAVADGPLLGCMAGASNVRIPKTFVPGSFGEHLTSYSAAFDKPTQTKATNWLRAGAGFTSGCVAEPYALWQKFPDAWIFDRMLDGLTALEAWTQSVRCPLQQLPIGDPLAKPWAPRVEPALEAPSGDRVRGRVELRASLPGKRDRKMPLFTWLVDGRVVATGRSFLWDTTRLPDGPHVVRAVVRETIGGIRHQGFYELAYIVENGKRGRR